MMPTEDSTGSPAVCWHTLASNTNDTRGIDSPWPAPTVAARSTAALSRSEVAVAKSRSRQARADRRR
jgi:hypothetical protein